MPWQGKERHTTVPWCPLCSLKVSSDKGTACRKVREAAPACLQSMDHSPQITLWQCRAMPETNTASDCHGSARH